MVRLRMQIMWVRRLLSATDDAEARKNNNEKIMII
jgi:hypothetical protein